MSRRNFLKAFGIGGSAGLLTACEASAGRVEGQDTSVGSMDLSGLEIIDAHVHPPQPMTLRQSYEGWNSSFVDALLPVYDFENKEALRSKLSTTFDTHLYNLPRQIGYYNYMSRVYGVEPNLEGFDSVVSEKIKGDFSGYITSILDREKIPKIVLQTRDLEPKAPDSHVPRDRFVWTYPIVDHVQPDWALQKGAENIADVTRLLDETVETCANNQCVGLKSSAAYTRDLAIHRVSRDEAEAAMRLLKANKPTGYTSFGGKMPLYDDPKLTDALRKYQDYLFKHLFVKAGRLKLPVIIHIAVALHPALRFDFNNPLDLFGFFKDDEIEKAETEFVLIHTGYPYHHFMASMLSQFPNVYTDVSFYAKFPGTLEEVLRALLALAPSEKVMHGSDSNNVPEEIGYCADNMRRVLAKVLRDYKSCYGWTAKDCEKMATNVMSKNARRIFKIKA